MNGTLTVFVTLWLGSCSFAQELTPEELATERLKLKNYAFCECLGHVFPGQDSLWIKDGSTAGYRETSHYDIDIYDTVRSRAEEFSKKIYESYNNSPLGLMKCLDFYNSRELDSLIVSFDVYLKVKSIIFWRKLSHPQNRPDTVKSGQ